MSAGARKQIEEATAHAERADPASRPAAGMQALGGAPLMIISSVLRLMFCRCCSVDRLLSALLVAACRCCQSSLLLPQATPPHAAEAPTKS